MTIAEYWEGATITKAGKPIGATRQAGRRGPQQSPTKGRTTIRLDPDVPEYFRSTGNGWRTRTDEVLKAYVAERIPWVPQSIPSFPSLHGSRCNGANADIVFAARRRFRYTVRNAPKPPGE